MSVRLRMTQLRVPAHHLRAPSTEPLPHVDRASDRWQRLRAAVGDGHAPYVDADLVTDTVWSTLHSITKGAS